MGTVDACADISTKKQLAFLMARQGVLPSYEEEAEEMQEGTQVRRSALPHACLCDLWNEVAETFWLHACGTPACGHLVHLPRPA